MKQADTTPKDAGLSTLANIGKTLETRLAEIGIREREDLERVGPVGAYLQLQAGQPERRLPVCYYLYSLEGALHDLHWNDLPADRKKELVSELEQAEVVRPDGRRTST